MPAPHRQFFTGRMLLLPSVLWHCWLGGRKGIRPVKMGDGGGWHWLLRLEWRPAGWSVCLPLLIFPCTIKSRSSLLAPAHPGGPGKRAVNGCGEVVVDALTDVQPTVSKHWRKITMYWKIWKWIYHCYHTYCDLSFTHSTGVHEYVAFLSSGVMLVDKDGQLMIFPHLSQRLAFKKTMSCVSECV